MGADNEQHHIPFIEDVPVSRTSRLVLFLVFFMVSLAPPLYDSLLEPRAQLHRFAELLRGLSSAAGLHEFQDRLARESSAGLLMRRPYQRVMSAVLNQGSHRVVAAPSHWLFYREDVDFSAGSYFLRGARPDDHASVQVLWDFCRQLDFLGIHVVVVPVPLSSTIYPDYVWPGYPKEHGPPGGQEAAEWFSALRARGVDVVDLIVPFWRARMQEPKLFARQNSHWSPRGVELAAGEVARQIHQFLEVPSRRRNFSIHHGRAKVRSDLLALLDLPPDFEAYPRPDEDFTQVWEEGALATAGPDAPVLVLGDSFSHIYAADNRDGIRGASLPERLMFELGVGVETLVKDGVSPFQMLEQLARHPSSLSGKKVLVWEFAMRSLGGFHANFWKSVKMVPPRTSAALSP